MKDLYHTFELEGDEKSGFFISMKNAGDKHGFGYNFIGSNNNVRHWKKKELAERHIERLREGLSKISIA